MQKTTYIPKKVLKPVLSFRWTAPNSRGAVLKGYKLTVDLEFISKELDRYAYENGIILDFSRPGKPTDNAFIESSNGSLQDECLNINWFPSIDDDRKKVNTWKKNYKDICKR